MENHVYWLLKRSYFDIFGDEKYSIFWAKTFMEIWKWLVTEKFLFWSLREWEIHFWGANKLMERWYLLITENFLFWTFRLWEIQSFFQTKSWWKDDIYLDFLNFPWYSRTWEIWFFVKWPMSNSIIKYLIFVNVPFDLLENQLHCLESFYKLTSFVIKHKLCVTKLTRKSIGLLNEWLRSVIIRNFYTCYWCRSTTMYNRPNFYCCYPMNMPWKADKYPPGFQKRHKLS